MKHRKFNLFVICGHCIVFAVLFGAGINNGFIVDQWFSPVFGYGSGVGIFVSIVSGLLIGLGSYGLFIHSERALKTILRLPQIEAWIRGISLVLLNVGFVALGIAGLVYRLSFLDSKGVGFLITIGVILEISTPIFGIVMQPLSHPATEVLEEELIDDFDQTTIREAYTALKALPPARRYAVYNAGLDESAFGEAIDELPPEVKKVPRRKNVLAGKSSVVNHQPKQENF